MRQGPGEAIVHHVDREPGIADDRGRDPHETLQALAVDPLDPALDLAALDHARFRAWPPVLDRLRLP
jgi:hypothetical protein